MTPADHLPDPVGTPALSVIVPTRNEAGNVAPLVKRLAAALAGVPAEVVFVDDSDDATPDVVAAVARDAAIGVRLIHRDEPAGGLSGAVVEGLRSSRAAWCVVMDGDLQHPPELIPALLARAAHDHADVVVASRHRAGGSTTGLNGWLRHTVSEGSTLLTRAMFPIRLRDCTDPMSGFFAVRRDRLDLASMRPRGFKILLEILVHHHLRVAEEPFVFGVRESGDSKASAAQGLQFLTQLTVLRFGRMSMFGVIGAFGAVVNLAIMAVLMAWGMWYLPAAIIGGAATIVLNFFLQEWFVFRDLRGGRHTFAARFVRSFTFNSAETTVRTALLWVIVEFTPIHSLVAQAVLLAVAFLARFTYHSLVVYSPRRRAASGPLVPAALDETETANGVSE